MALAYLKHLWKHACSDIENVFFDITTIFVTLALALCSLYTFILFQSGDYIKCAGDNGLGHSSVNKICFFESLFPVSTCDNDEHSRLSRDIYHWTPYILLIQAVLFYFPRFCLNQINGNKFNLALLSFFETGPNIDNEKRKDHLLQCYSNFIARLRGRFYVSVAPAFCEAFNIIVIAFQIYMMQVHLGTTFYEAEYSGNVFDVVFPKTLQCTHPEVGLNGSITSKVDTCDISINHTNESIFAYQWPCFNILLAVATLVVLYRIISALLYRSNAFNRFEFGRVNRGDVSPDSLKVVAKVGFLEWLKLRSLAGVMYADDFNLLLEAMADMLRFAELEEEFLNNATI